MAVARQKKSLEESDAGEAGTKVPGFKAGGMIINELPLKGLVRDFRQSCTFEGQQVTFRCNNLTTLDRLIVLH